MGNGKEIGFLEDRWVEVENHLGELAESVILDSESRSEVVKYVLQNIEWDWNRISKFFNKKYHLFMAVVKCPSE